MGTAYIDTHSHIHFSDFDDGRDVMLAQMREQGVGTIAIGTNLKTSKEVVALAQKNKNIWACIGVHPNECESFDEADYADFVHDETVVAVGECGLDYFRLKDGNNVEAKEKQKEKFIAQIDFAVQYNKVLMLHIRSSNNNDGTSTDDAHRDALKILKDKKQEHGKSLRLHSHFTTFGIKLGKEFLALDATFGIPGVVTYKNGKDLQELVRWLPLERIIVETDAPYAAPVPHRGKRNEPVFVIDTLRKIAELRNDDFETLRTQVLKNTKRIFCV